MVVIVIRAPSRETGDLASSTVTYSHSAVKTNAERYSPNGPPSYDSGVTVDHEPRDFKVFLRDSKPFFDRDHFFEASSKDSGYVEYQRLRDLELLKEVHERSKGDLRLDSPASKDSGFCERPRTCKITRIRYHPGPERTASCTYLSSTSSDNVTYCPSSSSQADPDNSLATTKEEEWVTKKKVELTTKRQIETRVKRQVVLEDGKVVEDSGPIVTTNTTEDTEKQEHNQSEHRKLGDDEMPEGDWMPVAGPGGLVKEVKERVVKSREETEERLETEDVQHMGDISDEGYIRAVTNGRNGKLSLESAGRDVVDSGPRVIHQSTKNRKVIDTEDKQELQERHPDGKLVTETRRTLQREEIDDANLPDEQRSNGESIDEATHKESSHHYRKTKDQDLTEYIVDGVKVGQKIRYQAESAEGDRFGDPADLEKLESLSARIRRMRLKSQHKLALDGVERKDALTKKPLDFDQEEETRKHETSKWLEHHFGSESTKSSKGSLDDLGDSPPPTQNSFINVTMTSRPLRAKSPRSFLPSSDEEKAKIETPREIFISSPECESPTNNGYFRGVTDWSSRQKQEKTEKRTPTNSPTPLSPAESPPLLITSHRINSLKSIPKRYLERETPARSNNPFQKNGWRDRSESPVRRNLVIPPSELVEVPSPPLRRKHRESNAYRKIEHDFRSWDRRQKRSEPKPDYTPPSESPSPVQEHVDESLLNHNNGNKKLYQRTRFAADIPPPQSPMSRPAPVKSKSKIGESFRKFVGKLRSSSSDRNRKKKTSRSPSPKENSYSAFHSVDNNIPYAGRSVGPGPVAPPRGRPVPSGPPGRAYAGDMERRHVQKYYLGEDPYVGSIYGREREYDGVAPLKSSSRRSSNRDNIHDYQTSTLGRLSKSTSRLVHGEHPSSTYDYDRGGVQTLPRKLKTESSTKRQVEAQRSLGETKTLSPNHWERPKPSKLSNSLINVSFVSHPLTRSNGLLNGPAKPARTYKSNLLRSKSFNVQAGETSYRDNYKSNPQLHRLHEIPQPLKSPGIISELSRSSRDITNDGFNFTKAEDKRRAFMSGLMSRAPELYKSLHGDETPEKSFYSSTPLRENGKRIDYSNSFRSTSTNESPIRSPIYYKHFQNENDRITPSPNFREVSHDGNTTKSIIRRGSDDDYSETVRITSKSDDPLRPSETNTVKTFSKKVIPTKNGRSKETIESEETKTVVKSRYFGGGVDRSKSPHGVVIEVRSPSLGTS